MQRVLLYNFFVDLKTSLRKSPVTILPLPFPEQAQESESTSRWSETKKVLAWQTGSRGKKTLKNRKNKLIQSKAETPIIESQNCRVGHDLARFCQSAPKVRGTPWEHPLGKRKTLCYSKSVAMVNLTLLLFFGFLLYLFFKDNSLF